MIIISSLEKYTLSNIISNVLETCGLDLAIQHGNNGFYTQIEVEGDIHYLVELEEVVFLIHFEGAESSFISRKISNVDFIFSVLKIFYDLEDLEKSSTNNNVKTSLFNLASSCSGKVRWINCAFFDYETFIDLLSEEDK